jgi:hypothetical protein
MKGDVKMDKKIVDVRTVKSDHRSIAKYDERLLKEINEMQDEGMEVEVQSSAWGVSYKTPFGNDVKNFFSATLIGKK